MGRSGPQFDFVRRVQMVKLFGWTIWSRPMKVTDESDEPEAPPDDKKKSRAKKTGRVRSVREILAAVPAISNALWHYSIGLLKSVIVEELEAEIEAGFEAVDLTGQAFGYYQAALVAAPAAHAEASRIQRVHAGLSGGCRAHPAAGKPGAAERRNHASCRRIAA